MSEEAHVRSTRNRANLQPIANKEKLGMWFFIGSEIILFGTLILSFSFFRLQFVSEYEQFRSNLNVFYIGINTFVLILSSLFVVLALQAAKTGNLNRTLVFLVIVVALGAIFVGGQAYEWSQLFGSGINLKNLFGSSFFIVTGIHGTHVLVGIAWAVFLLIYGINGGLDRQRYRAVEFFGLYWHFVDIVWIVLFSLIYLI